MNKKLVLQILKGVFAVGTFAVEAISKKDELNSIAKEAADIVMKKQSKKN